MRTDKELLELLLGNIDKLESGLCKISIKLNVSGVIDCNELERLKDIIKNNKPIFVYPFSIRSYHFRIGAKNPRIRYLKRLIKKYS